MRKTRLTVAVLLALVMLFSVVGTAFAANYTPVDPDDQGKTGIVGGDTLAFSEDTVWANLTARWGVRVIFQDGDEWNNAELQNELLLVTDGGSANTTAPGDPAHEGWTFTGWERVDENTGTSTLNDDGTVTGINGPGPIIYRAMYEPIPLKVGDLTVSKTVTGDLGDREKYFSFTVEFTAEGSYSYTGSKSGTISSGGTVQLKHGQSITISGLPAGTSYSVTESGNTGYRVYTSGDVGKIAANSTSTAKFTNARSKVPITGDNSNTGLWVGLLLVSAAGIGACIVMLRKKKRGSKHVRALLFLVLVGVMAFSGFGATEALAAGSGAAGYTYGQYDMSYLPGTADTVTNMPANETGLTPGRDNPYTVSSTVPVREGFEFIDWTLTWGTMEKPIPLTDYVVKYLDKATNLALAPEKIVSGLEVGAEVNETAIEVVGYTALAPTEATLVLAETGNEIIFWYEPEAPALTGYVVKYLEKGTNEPVAADKVQTGLEVGTSVTETAISVDGYDALDPTEATLVLAETGNEIIFYYERQPVLTNYVVKYLDKATNLALAPEKIVRGLEVGTEVTETAVDVEGYTALAPTEATLVLAESGNEIIFWYERDPVLTDYVVKYLDKATSDPVAEQKTVSGKEVGTTVTEAAVEVAGYTALAPTEQSIELAESGNEIIFWYEPEAPALTDYVVKYLEKGTNEPVAEQKTVEGKEVGTTVTETAVAAAGYTALAPTEQSIELAESGNEIIFWYEKEAPALTDYVVKYLDVETNEPVAPDKVVTDVEIGSTVRERAIDVDGYETLDPTSETLVLTESGNEIVFWYLRIEEDPA